MVQPLVERDAKLNTQGGAYGNALKGADAARFSKLRYCLHTSSPGFDGSYIFRKVWIIHRGNARHAYHFAIQAAFAQRSDPVECTKSIRFVEL